LVELKTFIVRILGEAEKLAKEQKTKLEEQYGKGLGELAQTYATEMPKIAQAYAARNRITFRAGAEQAAQQGYQKQLSDLTQAQKDVLAKLGQGYAETSCWIYWRTTSTSNHSR
jgi:hypothetical protein